MSTYSLVLNKIKGCKREVLPKINLLFLFLPVTIQSFMSLLFDILLKLDSIYCTECTCVYFAQDQGGTMQFTHM